jgi:hypothetical protein
VYRLELASLVVSGIVVFFLLVLLCFAERKAGKRMVRLSRSELEAAEAATSGVGTEDAGGKGNANLTGLMGAINPNVCTALCMLLVWFAATGRLLQ